MGLPLLTSQKDYVQAAKSLSGSIPAPETGTAAVLVGHGTDHPSWSAYPAFEDVLRQSFGPHLFVGVVEGYPEKERILARVHAAGFKRICLIPFMLVAGVHFKEDLTCEQDSWQKYFESAGILVDVVDQGIGSLPGIQEIFCCHMEEALDIIPL